MKCCEAFLHTNFQQNQKSRKEKRKSPIAEIQPSLVVLEVAALRLVEVTLIRLGPSWWDAKAVAALPVHPVLQRVPGLASNFHGVSLPWDL